MFLLKSLTNLVKGLFGRTYTPDDIDVYMIEIKEMLERVGSNRFKVSGMKYEFHRSVNAIELDAYYNRDEVKELLLDLAPSRLYFNGASYPTYTRVYEIGEKIIVEREYKGLGYKDKVEITPLSSR